MHQVRRRATTTPTARGIHILEYSICSNMVGCYFPGEIKDEGRGRGLFNNQLFKVSGNMILGIKRSKGIKAPAAEFNSPVPAHFFRQGSPLAGLLEALLREVVFPGTNRHLFWNV